MREGSTAWKAGTDQDEVERMMKWKRGPKKLEKGVEGQEKLALEKGWKSEGERQLEKSKGSEIGRRIRAERGSGKKY